MGDEHLGGEVPMLAGGVLQKCTETHRGRGGVKIGEYWEYALFEWLRVRTGKQMGKMCKSIAKFKDMELFTNSCIYFIIMFYGNIFPSFNCIMTILTPL